MPGPKHGTPRRSGNRNDPNGHARKPERKSAAKLAKRQESVPSSGYYTTGVKTSFFTKPGSQNRKK